MYSSLQSIKDYFHFHFVNAEGTIEEVERRIQEELSYQSAMELGDETFELVRGLPLASEVVRNSRFKLVQRLDSYQRDNHELFAQVIDVLRAEFEKIIMRQALSGQAIIRR